MSFSLSEYTKIDAGWGFAPESTGGAYSAPPNPLAGFKGPLHSMREWRGREGRTRGRGRGEGKGKGGEKGEVGGIAPWMLWGQTPLKKWIVQ